eukprot:TRINITY_DN2986_c0_g1_i1.p1 TRINITY_DN2986_c0_g1~~TRINITY_DN2986_c0_g1_i1.p1  ORF type:complete len:262 (-),score=82.31 TRINITY_DN2986_c0_g1_i1:93-878(-)
MQKIKNLLHKDSHHTTDNSHQGHGIFHKHHEGPVVASTPAKVVEPTLKPHTTETTRAAHVPVVPDSTIPPHTTASTLPISHAPAVAPVEPVNVMREAPVIERVEKEVVVHERIHPVEKHEIQPVIYRERELVDVKQITEQLHETQVQPTIVQQRQATAEYRPVVVERAAPIQENVILPSSTMDVTQSSRYVNEPIIKEKIHKTIIEEIQPILERDVVSTTIVKHTMPIYENMVETKVYRQYLDNPAMYGKSHNCSVPPRQF